MPTFPNLKTNALNVLYPPDAGNQLLESLVKPGLAPPQSLRATFNLLV